MQTKMVVSGLTIDPNNNAPIVILRDDSTGRVLPIWIGVIEASAIAFELEKVQLTRPMTHDLLRSTVDALGGKVQRVMIVDLRDSTYYATVVLAQGERVVEIDARPSDAIALAMRVAAPIFCEAAIIEQASQRQHLEQGEPASLRPPVQVDGDGKLMESVESLDRDEAEELNEGPKLIVNCGTGTALRELLENLAPEDFGKYKM